MNTKSFSVVIVLAALALGACGGGGGADPAATDSTGPPPSVPAPSRSTGTVAVLLTDAPGPSWDEAWATIESITLIGSAGQQTIFSGSETVDLLSLPDFYEVFALSDEVLPGTVNKIRLMVDKLKLVDLDSEGNVIRSVMARLVGNGKMDLDPQGSFVVGAGDTLFIEIDFDMNKSFKTTQTGHGDVIVRPVVRVNVTRQEPLARLTRLRGVVEEIDADAQSFLLCQSGLVAAPLPMARNFDDDEVRRCVEVATDDLTGVFGADGLPVTFADLAVDDELTAIGRLERSQDADDDEDEGEDEDGDDDGEDEEEGERGDDSREGKNDGRFGHHSGHSGGCNHFDELVLQAVTIEVGDEFARVAGTADTAVTNDAFDLAVEPGQELETTDEVLATTLFPETRIFNTAGEELDATAIVEGVGVLADGVLVSSETEPDSLRAALLILGVDQGQGEEVLRGDVVAIDVDAGQLRLLTGSTEQCVDAAAADIFLISNDGGLVSERGTLADLEPGQTADVFGAPGSSGDCFVATDILVDAQSGNTAPVANAGADVTVGAGVSVTLDGSASSDADGDTLTYQWTLTARPTGSTATLTAADTVAASFTADTAGAYTAELIVSDAFGDSAPDTVTVTAN